MAWGCWASPQLFTNQTFLLQGSDSEKTGRVDAATELAFLVGDKHCPSRQVGTLRRAQSSKDSTMGLQMESEHGGASCGQVEWSHSPFGQCQLG